jgi:hypothetical protein
MNRFLALVLALPLVGCAHTNVSLNSSGSAAGGTSTVSGHVSAGGSGAAAVVLFAITAVAIHSSELSNGGTSYRGDPSAAITPTQPAPELDGSRRVNEQDCAKPIKDWSANLKCR